MGSAIFAQIPLTSTEAGRASAISTASAARQIGLLLGPALNLPLSSCNFYIGPFHVNNFTGPGVSNLMYQEIELSEPLVFGVGKVQLIQQ